MTNKMRLIFVITTVVSVAFVMLITPFAVDIAGQVLSVIANAINLHKAPTPSALAILAISGLYLVFRHRRHF